MSKIEIAHVPRLYFSGVAIHALAEKCQLESEAMPVFGLYVAGVIPPFRLEIRMIEVIARKLVAIAGQGDAVTLSRYLRPGMQHQQRGSEARQAIPHARPQSG